MLFYNLGGKCAVLIGKSTIYYKLPLPLITLFMFFIFFYIPNFQLIAGESLHHELELLVEAGISESEVIKIATRNGAESLGILNQTGTIDKGKQADMVVLSSNPLKEISNTKEIEAVVSDGKIIGKDIAR